MKASLDMNNENMSDFDWLDEVLGIPEDSEPILHMCQPSTSEPFFMLPLSHASATSEFLKKFNDDNSLTKRAKTLTAQLTAKSGVLEKLMPKVNAEGIAHLRRWPLISELERQLGEPKLLAAITIGERRRNRKPVLHLVTPEGRNVGFAKVGWSELTNRLVKQEATLLRQVENRLGPKLLAPRVITEFEWASGTVVVTSPLPLNPAPNNNEFSSSHFLTIAEATGSSVREFSEIYPLGDVEAVRDHVNLGVLKSRYSGDMIRMGCWHGDLTPWNTSTNGDVISVWDWEFGSADAPVGFDQLHRAFEILRRNMANTATEAIHGVHSQAEQILQPLNQPVESVFRLYLIELMKRELMLEGQLFANDDLNLLPQLIAFFREDGSGAFPKV